MTDKQQAELTHRSVKVSNLNFRPEWQGEELVERVDLSIEMLLLGDDLGAESLIRTRLGTASTALFDEDGEPILRDCSRIPLDLKMTGTLELATANGDNGAEFEAALLKKVVLQPMLGRQATMRCQVRVDPHDQLEFLAQLVIEREATFRFVGLAEAREAAKEEDNGQQKMAV